MPAAVEAGAAAILIGRAAARRQLCVPIIRVDDPRHTLALMASRYFARQPRTVAAVTGTNGKTSVSVFLRQIWEKAGPQGGEPRHDRPRRAGHVGRRQPHDARSDQAARDHGRPRRRRRHASRAGGVEPRPRAAPARRRAASPPAPSPICRATTSTIIRRSRPICTPSSGSSTRCCRRAPPPSPTPISRKRTQVQAIAKAARARLFQRRPQAARRCSSSPSTRMHDGSRLLIEAFGEKHYVPLPLVGDFQMSNALVAAGARHRHRRRRRARCSPRSPSLKGASGRLELVGTHPSGAQVFVDYAHTPDALANALQALAPARRGTADRRLRRRRRPRSRQAPADGRGGGRRRRPPDRHRRQSAQRRPGGDPQGGHRRRAERGGDRRPPRRDPRRRLRASSRATSCSSPARATRPGRRSATRCCPSPTRTRRGRRCSAVGGRA